MKESTPSFKFQWTDHSSNNLKKRILQLRKNDRRLDLDASTGAIQFLRGAASRASFVLPEFYEHVGSVSHHERHGLPYWQQVRAASAENSSLQSISLACRSIFDDSRKGMTGKTFSLISNDSLLRVAEYWSSKSKRPLDTAIKTLEFLRRIFEACSKQPKALLEERSLLARRVGLLKYYADRCAAHISLDPYSFHLSDIIHVVAALTILGAVIEDFDDPTKGERYFDDIDVAAWHAGDATYPNLPIPRLFNQFRILEQGRLYCKPEWVDGPDMLLNKLPAALGYWDSEEATTPE